MEQVQAASEVLGCVRSRKLACFYEQLIKIEYDLHQPVVLEILLQLALNDQALFPRHQAASDEPLERVGNLELMNHSKRNLP